MLKIRLQRFGKKNQPSFRVVVGDSHNSTKSGRFKETLGWVNPLKHERSLERDRIFYWISQGAQTSDTLHNLLVKEGIVKGAKRDVAPRRKKEDADEKAAKGAADTPTVEGAVKEENPAPEGRGSLNEIERQEEKPEGKETPEEEKKSEEVKME